MKIGDRVLVIPTGGVGYIIDIGTDSFGKWYVKTSNKGQAKQLKEDGFVKFYKGDLMANGEIEMEIITSVDDFDKHYDLWSMEDDVSEPYCKKEMWYRTDVDGIREEHELELLTNKK